MPSVCDPAGPHVPPPVALVPSRPVNAHHLLRVAPPVAWRWAALCVCCRWHSLVPRAVVQSCVLLSCWHETSRMGHGSYMWLFGSRRVVIFCSRTSRGREGVREVVVSQETSRVVFLSLVSRWEEEKLHATGRRVVCHKNLISLDLTVHPYPVASGRSEIVVRNHASPCTRFQPTCRTQNLRDTSSSHGEESMT